MSNMEVHFIKALTGLGKQRVGSNGYLASYR